MSRVLVVDDEADVRELLAKVLTRAGHAVRVAASGEDALALLEAEDADCVVVDKVLPQMHGGEVVAAVRARWPRTAVVVMTGQPTPLAFDDERPDALLSKPFKSLAAIDEAIAAALQSAQQAPSLAERLTAVVADIAPRLKKRGS